METANKATITVQTTVNVPVAKVWEYWNEPEHIMQWCQASPDWHAPKSENDLRVGGKISITMAAKDGSMSFEFWGIYTKVDTNKAIAYTLGDDRKVEVLFHAKGDTTEIVETFEPESTNPVEMQQFGWQAILDSFQRYAEAQ